MVDDCQGGCCRITLPLTPKEILANHAVDVFDETIGALSYAPDPTVITALQAQAWAKFRNRPIGDYDYEYWLEQLADLVNLNWIWYSKTLAVLLDAEQLTIAAQKDVTSETTVRDLDATEGETSAINKDVTVGETRDLTKGKTGTDTNTLANGKIVSQAESKAGSDVVEVEAFPDVAAGATPYLSGRTTTTPGAENTVTTINSGSDVQTTVINESETDAGTVDTITSDVMAGSVDRVKADDETITLERTHTIYSGLNAEATLKLMDAIKAGNERFVNELEVLFLNRW